LQSCGGKFKTWNLKSMPSMKPLIVSCPKCGYDVTDNITGDLFCCRKCHHYFNVSQPANPPALTKPLPKEEDRLEKERSQLKERTRFFCALALVSLAVSILLFAYAIRNGIVGESSAIPPLVFAGILLSAALWLYLIAQIIHIRANTLK